MPYTSAYPRQFDTFIKFLNIELSGDPTIEETALYSYYDDLFETCYVEAAQYCGQPLQAGTVYYQFPASKGKQGLNALHWWKFIPYNANTTLTLVQYRDDEFGTYANVSNSNYNYNQESYGNYIVFRDKSSGQYKITLSTGWSDATMPYQIMQGIAEIAALIYKQSPVGGNWFGLSSISTGGAGQNVSNSLKEKIDWHKYFAKYVIPTV